MKFFWTPPRLSEALARFQAVEADGVWHLMRALDRTSGPTRVELFGQVIEEMSHADQFSKLAKLHSGQPISYPNSEREDLLPQSEAVWKTLAYVHVGEEDATRQFRAIIESLPEGGVRSTFTGIAGDESGHVDLTESIALAAGISKRQLRAGLRGVRWRRLRDAWMRVGKGAVNRLSFLLLSVVYWVAVPFLCLGVRSRLTGRHPSLAADPVKRLAR